MSDSSPSVTGCCHECKPTIGPIDARDPLTGCTPLHVAVTLGHAECTRALLKLGAALDTRQLGGWTPLLIAAEGGAVSCLRILLRCGANPEDTIDDDSEQCALHRLAKSTTLDCAVVIACMQLLLDHNAPVDPRDVDGATPFRLVSPDRVQVRQWLLQAGADINTPTYEGWTPLIEAVAACSQPGTRFLLDAGATLEAKCLLGHTALSVALCRHDIALTKMLMHEGANLNAPTFKGNTPLKVAAEVGFTAGVEFLVASGADVAARNSEGQSALHRAVLNNYHPGTYAALLRLGAGTWSDQSFDNETPLMVAARWGNVLALTWALNHEQLGLLERHVTVVGATLFASATPSCRRVLHAHGIDEP